MGPTVDPVPPEDSVPSRAEVVIVGGGIIGTSAALYLAQEGVTVALCEKGHIAGEQSSRNWGWVRGAAEGGTCDRCGGAALRGHNPHRLRGARGGAQRGKSLGGRH